MFDGTGMHRPVVGCLSVVQRKSCRLCQEISVRRNIRVYQEGVVIPNKQFRNNSISNVFSIC